VTAVVDALAQHWHAVQPGARSAEEAQQPMTWQQQQVLPLPLFHLMMLMHLLRMYLQFL
jgi:hypothetical protein